jgi:hypothetical protein
MKKMCSYQKSSEMFVRNLYNFGFKIKTFFLKKLIEARLVLNNLVSKRFAATIN